MTRVQEFVLLGLSRAQKQGESCLPPPDPLPADLLENASSSSSSAATASPQAHVLFLGNLELPGDVLRVRDHAQPARGAVDGTLPRALPSLYDPALLFIACLHRVYPGWPPWPVTATWPSAAHRTTPLLMRPQVCLGLAGTSWLGGLLVSVAAQRHRQPVLLWPQRPQPLLL